MEKRKRYCKSNIWEKMGSSRSRVQVENLALNMRGNGEMNKDSPRGEGRQMEQRRGAMSFILLCF